jgi:hypothetical protein
MQPINLEDSAIQLKPKLKVEHPCPVFVLQRPVETTLAAILLPVLAGTSCFPVQAMRLALPVVTHCF